MTTKLQGIVQATCKAVTSFVVTGGAVMIGTLGVATAQAERPCPPEPPVQQVAPLSFHDGQFYVARSGTYLISRSDFLPGGLAEASLCIEGDGRPSQNCFSVGNWTETRVTLTEGQHFAVWSRDVGHGAGEASRRGTDGPTNTMRFGSGSGFQVAFTVNPG